MRCVISSSNIKTLGKAVHSLARIGEEVYLESTKDGMILRTINSSRSAYACFKFESAFFISFNSNTDMKCKIPMKSLLMPFKNPSTNEKITETCSFELTESCDNFIVQIYCKHELIKSYHLSLIESETLEAVFDKEDYKNVISAQSRMLLKTIQNFHTTVEEVTLTVTNEKVVIKNYVDDEPDPNEIIHTEITLESEEFDSYQLEEEAMITFCLKELRAVISFAESCNVPVLIYFQVSGRPIVFNVKDIIGVEAEFILATLSDQSASQISNIQISSNITASNRNNVEQYRKETNTRINNINSSIESNNNDIRTHISQTEKSTSDDNLSAERSGTNNERIILPPPNKKFRSLFLGLSHLSKPTQYTSMMPDPDEILAEDSEEEEND